MEAAVALDYLKDFKSYLGTLTAEQLRKLRVNGLPALHYLATVVSKLEEDQVKLFEIIKLFKNAGCDLNERTDNFVAPRKRETMGFTPLLVAIERSNPQFVGCLLQNGAKLDVPDQIGFLPLQWAEFIGDADCFQKLIEAGAPPIPNYVLPILHTAVEEGNLEEVAHLLERKLVDVNQKAIYKDSLPPQLGQRSALQKEMMSYPQTELHEGRFILYTVAPGRTFLSSFYLESFSMTLITPLELAVRLRNQRMVWTLLKYGANVSGFNELHFCIRNGEMYIACMLLNKFSHQDLANDKIEDKWALHCLPEYVFRIPRLRDNTFELIEAYVRAGWNINCVGGSTANIRCFGRDPELEFSLLHLACYFRSQDLIKDIVKLGADVNLKTGGFNILYPLQISIMREDWSSVEFLMANGADVHVVGGFKSVLYPIWISEPGSRDTDLECHFTSLELLLQLGDEGGMPALEEMLKGGIPNPPKIAFQRAIYGVCYAFIAKVVEQLCGVQKVKMEELMWLPLQKVEEETEYVPSVYWLIQNIMNRYCSCHDIRGAVAKVVEVMGRFGYDFTLQPTPRQDTGSISRNVQEPLIYYILKIERPYPVKLGLNLLETFLNFDPVALNVRDSEKLNPVEYVLKTWSSPWIRDARRMTAAIELLIRHGVDASGVVVGEGFKYFQGYLPMMQLLYSSGAKIKPEVFIPSASIMTVAQLEDDNQHLPAGTVAQEIHELRQWKQRFDSERKLTLKHLCLVETRKMLKTIGALRSLNEELPGTVVEEVAGEIMDFE